MNLSMGDDKWGSILTLSGGMQFLKYDLLIRPIIKCQIIIKKKERNISLLTHKLRY